MWIWFCSTHYTFMDAAGITKHQWNKIWLWPAASALLVLILFAFLFKAKKEKPMEEIAALATVPSDPGDHFHLSNGRLKLFGVQ